MRVPVRNLYYLLAYAWDVVPPRGFDDLDARPADTPVDLFASILCDEVAQLVRRGLERDYREFEEEGRRVRGKLRLGETMARALAANAMAACIVDERTDDIVQNRILRATLRMLTEFRELDRGLRDRCVSLFRSMDGVGFGMPTLRDFERVRLHRSNAEYRLPLAICRLLLEHSLADAFDGARRFVDFRNDERQMGLVFEAFVRRFLRREQSDFRVSKSRLPWEARGIENARRWLPVLATDIELRAPGQHVIVETKCTARTWLEHHGSRKIRSGHLCQLFAYLRNAAVRGGPDAPVPSGVLLYATSQGPMRVETELHGHSVSVRTLNLDQDWRGIRADLLSIADGLRPDGSGSGATEQPGKA